MGNVNIQVLEMMRNDLPKLSSNNHNERCEFVTEQLMALEPADRIATLEQLYSESSESQAYVTYQLLEFNDDDLWDDLYEEDAPWHGSVIFSGYDVNGPVV